MVATTGVEVLGDQPVVVKRVTGGDAAVEALRREGERLRQASHPGVVSVVRSVPEQDGWELVLSHGGRSLATVDGCSAPEAAVIVAGLASTLADLHQIGITHGRIDASHVLLSDTGCPRLCGFGDGTDQAAPHDDVAALGALLEQLLGGEVDVEPMPEHRWRGRRRWRGWDRRALLSLADHASADDPSRRPTARRLAAAIAAIVPAADQVPPADPPDDDPIERLRPPLDPAASDPGRRARPIGLAIAGLLLAVVAAQRFRTTDGPVAPSPVEAAPPDVLVAEPVMGSVLVEGGRRYRVGQDGDHLLVGDWSCDGRPTPAVFRPSTHEVFVFDRWTVAEPLSVRPTDTVADAVEMVSTTRDDGCPELGLRTVRGDLVRVDPGGPGA